MKEDEMGRECSTNGDKKNAYRICMKARRKKTTRKTKTYVSGQYYNRSLIDRMEWYGLGRYGSG
jgi:hypothetical protein